MILSSSLRDCVIVRVIRSDGRLVVAHARRVHGRYPTCGTTSSAVHSRYERRPADLPSIGQPRTLRLRVRRFYGHHGACRRHTFAEPFPRLMPPRARRTRRLAQVQTRIGLVARGEAGARLTGQRGMQTSPDTILRLVHRLPMPREELRRAVGIDDWAIRKGRTYGALLVELERRCPIDLLPDRSEATVADWLRRHPGIRIVARDRSTEYARAAAGAPAALEVADRWHLLLNMRQALERWLGRATGLARATARRYAQAESFPERAIRRPNPSRLDPFLAHLE